MSYHHFVEQVRTATGSSDAARIERAIAATLEVLGERLRTVDAAAVARQLPPELGQFLRGTSELPRSASPHELVQQLCGEAGFAREELRAVCRVLAQTLDEQGRAQLRMQPLASLFVQ